VSTQQEPASGSALADKKKVFRLPAPLVLWWAWVAFAVANLADLAIQGRDATSVQIAIGLLAITGVVYACAFRPRVITDAGGITMLNPLREYRVPWARVSDVYLGESVQVHVAAAAPATGKGKVLHSWALYSPRRSRLKAEVRGRRMDRNLVSRPGGYARMPVEAREVAKQHPAELMAREIQSLAQKARERGAPDGPVVASWAWPSLAAVLVPALLLALVIVIS
jgi:signal transduction histidine kinase